MSQGSHRVPFRFLNDRHAYWVDAYFESGTNAFLILVICFANVILKLKVFKTVISKELHSAVKNRNLIRDINKH